MQQSPISISVAYLMCLLEEHNSVECENSESFYKGSKRTFCIKEIKDGLDKRMALVQLN